MSTRIEGTTVLICREDISANFPGGVDAFTGTLDAASIRWQVSDPPSDVADESGERLLSLGVQNGIETVLDLETGAQTSTALAQHEPSGTPVHDELLTALDAIGWEYHHSKAPEASSSCRERRARIPPSSTPRSRVESSSASRTHHWSFRFAPGGE